MIQIETCWITLAMILFFFLGCNEVEEQIPDPVDEMTFYDHETFVMGADLSYVNAIEDFGGLYKDEGIVGDPFKIFKDHGSNLVRVRIWHTPKWQIPLFGEIKYGQYEDVEKTIKRSKEQGMAINLDIHYSDDWADTGNQSIPDSWKGLDLEGLKDSVYTYTFSILNRLESKNLTPEYVQIGNETNQGMLFPEGRVENNNWASFGALLKEGIRAVREFSLQEVAIKPKIILHVAQLQNAEWWTNGIVNIAGVNDFDIIGISHYYIWSEVESMFEVRNIIANLGFDYQKEVMIVETAYPWTADNADSYNNIFSGTQGAMGFGVSPQDQLNYLKDLTQAVISGGGRGIIYWEPDWITSSMPTQWGIGSSWENNAFFDFNRNAIQAINFMNAEYQF